MDIEESLREVLECSGERFADRFYRALFEQFPDLEEFFQGVNLMHQAAMLTMAIQIIVQHFQKPSTANEDYLKVIGYRHQQRGVDEEHYRNFRDALIATLADFHGDRWTPELADVWQTAYEHALGVILSGYPVD